MEKKDKMVNFFRILACEFGYPNWFSFESLPNIVNVVSEMKWLMLT